MILGRNCNKKIDKSLEMDLFKKTDGFFEGKIEYDLVMFIADSIWVSIEFNDGMKINI